MTTDLARGLTVLPCNPASLVINQVSAKIEQADVVTTESLQTAASLLKRDQLVAFPTETVYGLGANALSSQAVQQIFKAKGRPLDNPLIAHISSVEMLERYIPTSAITPVYRALIDSFWPGPITMLFPTPRDPSWFAPEVTAKQPTVGIRMPSHPLARALIALANVPLAAPSANASGRPSPTQASHVISDMQTRKMTDPTCPDIAVLQGLASDVGLESTVVDNVTDPEQLRILRPGGVGPDVIEQCLKDAGLDHVCIRVYGRDWKSTKEEAAPSTPGMKYKHYSPSCKVVCVRSSSSSSETLVSLLSQFKNVKKVGFMSFQDGGLNLSSDQYDVTRYNFGPAADALTHATRLFDGLRQLELDGTDLIVVECPQPLVWNDGIGLAVKERLSKAAGSTESEWHLVST